MGAKFGTTATAIYVLRLFTKNYSNYEQTFDTKIRPILNCLSVQQTHYFKN